MAKIRDGGVEVTLVEQQVGSVIKNSFQVRVDFKRRHPIRKGLLDILLHCEDVRSIAVCFGAFGNQIEGLGVVQHGGVKCAVCLVCKGSPEVSQGEVWGKL